MKRTGINRRRAATGGRRGTVFRSPRQPHSVAEGPAARSESTSAQSAGRAEAGIYPSEGSAPAAADSTGRDATQHRDAANLPAGVPTGASAAKAPAEPPTPVDAAQDATQDSGLGGAAEAGIRRSLRARLAPVYLGLIVLAAGIALGRSWVVRPAQPEDALGFVVLLGLGVASARLRDVESDSQIDLSFTAVILLSAIPLCGPVTAGLLGALIPLLDLRRGFGPATIFNSAMTCLVACVSALTYLASGGMLPVAVDARATELLTGVAVPLLVADIALCLLNVAVLGTMIWLTLDPGKRIPLDPFLATLPLYLGYALTALAFVVLWGPGGLGPLAAALIVAPLLVARWAYVQHIDEFRSRSRILATLAAAGQSRDGSDRRAARIDALASALATELGLPRRTAQALRHAAALHDIGIITVPRRLLDADTRDVADLDVAELSQVRSHAHAGYEVIKEIDFLGEAALAVRHHHERWDGRGYPDGLVGPAIPQAARVLAVVDAYEALAWPDDESAPAARETALAQVLARSGAQFDPQVVEALQEVLAAPAILPSPLADLAGPAPAHGWWSAAARRPRLRHADPRVSDAMATVSSSLPRELPPLPPGGRGARIGEGPWAVVGLVASLVLLLLTVLAVHGQQPRPEAVLPTVLLVYLLTLLAAEPFRLRMRGRLDTSPTAAATGLALAATISLPGGAVVPVSTWQVVAVVLAAQAVHWFAARRRESTRGRIDALVDAGIRAAAVACASIIMRDIPWPGGPLTVILVEHPGWWQALILMLLVGAVLLAELPARAWRTARTDRSRLPAVLFEELRAGLGLGAAIGATAVLLAIAEQILGLVAVPLLLLPLALTQLAVRSYVMTNEAYLRCVRALSRMPELAGLVRTGHAAHVAALAVGIGRRLGMRERDVVDLEYAALLHDIGQVSLQRPIPRGATVLAAPADQERIAEHGARIVEQTGKLSEVAQVVRDQAVPYHQVIGTRSVLPLASRIIKVANAFEDYLASDPDAGAGGALERLYLGLGHEFDPRVVRACEAHVAEPGPGRGATVEPKRWRLGRKETFSGDPSPVRTALPGERVDKP